MPAPLTKARAPRAGLRERSKIDKRRRIREAAREVFVERGYEAATTRDIAARADVSIGTVFVYARDKRDLLLMIINDELDAVSARGEAALARPGSLLERLLGYFRLRYRYWASEPRLARPALRETFDFPDADKAHGEETRRFFARRPLMVGQIAELVRTAQAAGEIVPDVAADEVASLVFNLYLIEVRHWLSNEAPKLAAGINRLGKVLQLFLRGIGATQMAPKGK